MEENLTDINDMFFKKKKIIKNNKNELKNWSKFFDFVTQQGAVN